VLKKVGKMTYNHDKNNEPIVQEPRPRIPPGTYEVICYDMNVKPCQGGSKRVFVQFRIYGGEYDGTELFMCCPKPAGMLRERHKLHIQMSLALKRRPNKGERLSKKIFVGKMYHVIVGDTKRKYKETNQVMPDYMQYSVVKSILEVITGSPNES